jgi:hypothetical protein
MLTAVYRFEYFRFQFFEASSMTLQGKQDFLKEKRTENASMWFQSIFSKLQ